ncbi:MAG: flagellar motor protein MotB [Thermodesulfovibrionales bacterium]
MRRRRRGEEEHENHERWLISYADFITLLFTFFAALYALSTVDKAKVEQFSGSLRESFRIIDAPIPLGESTNRSLAGSLDRAIRGTPGVSVRAEFRGVVVTFSDAVLFPPGSAEIRPDAFGVIEQVAKVMETVPGRITIEGHTDSTLVTGGKYLSNWELSTARAAGILHFLVERGMDPNKFSVAGYAEYRPVAGNDTEEGRARNRRVELVIAR